METQSGEDAVDVDVDVGFDFGGGSSNIDATRDLDMGLVCFSEKVSNLSIFVMNLETLAGELEALDLDNDGLMDMNCIGKVLEFDLLCGVLDSVVRELDGFLDTLHAEIAYVAGEGVLFSSSLCQHKLHDSELCLEQYEAQLSEIKKQYANFQRTLSSCKREENGDVREGEIVLEDDQSLTVSRGLKMKTIEEQRHILRMLEKSLASEMDLEKNINDTRQVEEKLKQRLVSFEQDVVLMEEEANDVWERWFEADNTCVILMGISIDLLGRVQISQFSMNGLSQHESEHRAKLKESECQLLSVKASADEYQKQYNFICSEIRDMENIISELKGKAYNAQTRANTAEAECKLLKEANTELNKELALLKDGSGVSKSVELLERQLKDSNLQLQHAVATAEASQEKQSMLFSMIKDMELVIKELKSKVSRAENQADNAEEKCIILSESNIELNEELSFLRSRLECVEGSLHQVEEAKVKTTKDISKRTKAFKTLVAQLAVERERLYKQLSSLASENKILVMKLKQSYKDPSQEAGLTSATDHEVDRTRKKLSTNGNEVGFAESVPDLGTMRRVDAGVLNFKQLFISMLVLLISAVTFLYLNDVNIDIGL